MEHCSGHVVQVGREHFLQVEISFLHHGVNTSLFQRPIHLEIRHNIGGKKDYYSFLLLILK